MLCDLMYSHNMQIVGIMGLGVTKRPLTYVRCLTQATAILLLCSPTSSFKRALCAQNYL